MTKRPPEKSRKFEKNRRDRINLTFDVLAKLLPQYSESKKFSKIEILRKAIVFLEDVQSRIKDIIKITDCPLLGLLERLSDHFKSIESHNKLLSNTLNAAGIPVPELPIKEKPIVQNEIESIKENSNKKDAILKDITLRPAGRPPKYSGKFSVDKAKELQTIEKENHSTESAEQTDSIANKERSNDELQKESTDTSGKVVQKDSETVASTVVTANPTTIMSITPAAVIYQGSNTAKLMDTITHSTLTNPIMATGIILPPGKYIPLTTSVVMAPKPVPVIHPHVEGKVAIPMINKPIIKEKKKRNRKKASNKQLDKEKSEILKEIEPPKKKRKKGDYVTPKPTKVTKLKKSSTAKQPKCDKPIKNKTKNAKESTNATKQIDTVQKIATNVTEEKSDEIRTVSDTQLEHSKQQNEPTQFNIPMNTDECSADIFSSLDLENATNHVSLSPSAAYLVSFPVVPSVSARTVDQNDDHVPSESSSPVLLQMDNYTAEQGGKGRLVNNEPPRINNGGKSCMNSRDYQGYNNHQQDNEQLESQNSTNLMPKVNDEKSNNETMSNTRNYNSYSDIMLPSNQSYPAVSYPSISCPTSYSVSSYTSTTYSSNSYPITTYPPSTYPTNCYPSASFHSMPFNNPIMSSSSYTSNPVSTGPLSFENSIYNLKSLTPLPLSTPTFTFNLTATSSSNIYATSNSANNTSINLSSIYSSQAPSCIQIPPIQTPNMAGFSMQSKESTPLIEYSAPQTTFTFSLTKTSQTPMTTAKTSTTANSIITSSYSSMPKISFSKNDDFSHLNSNPKTSISFPLVNPIMSNTSSSYFVPPIQNGPHCSKYNNYNPFAYDNPPATNRIQCSMYNTIPSDDILNFSFTLTSTTTTNPVMNQKNTSNTNCVRSNVMDGDKMNSSMELANTYKSNKISTKVSKNQQFYSFDTGTSHKQTKQAKQSSGNSKNSNQSHKNHVNWMTSNDSKANNNMTFPQIDTTFDFIPSTSSSYFPVVSQYCNSYITQSSHLPNSSSTLPMVPTIPPGLTQGINHHKADITFGHSVIDDNQSWLPNKVVENTNFVPSSLPMLHGDLALNNYSAPFIPNGYSNTQTQPQPQSKCPEKRTQKHTTVNQQNDLMSQSNYNFHSVDQLVQTAGDNSNVPSNGRDPIPKVKKRDYKKNTKQSNNHQQQNQFCGNTEPVNGNQYCNESNCNWNSYSTEALLSTPPKKDKTRQYANTNDTVNLPTLMLEPPSHFTNTNDFMNDTNYSYYGSSSNFMSQNYSGQDDWNTPYFGNDILPKVNNKLNNDFVQTPSNVGINLSNSIQLGNDNNQSSHQTLPRNSNSINYSSKKSSKAEIYPSVPMLDASNNNYFSVPLTIPPPPPASVLPPPNMDSMSSSIPPYLGGHHSYPSSGQMVPPSGQLSNGGPILMPPMGGNTSNSITNFNLSTICPEINDKVRTNNW